MGKDKNSQQYKDWFANHKCSMDHEGSSGCMEPAGDVEIFSRSEARHKLQYTEYIGDGDSSAFMTVLMQNPMPTVFQDLANDDVLSRCLDAYTQNPKE